MRIHYSLRQIMMKRNRNICNTLNSGSFISIKYKLYWFKKNKDQAHKVFLISETHHINNWFVTKEKKQRRDYL